MMHTNHYFFKALLPTLQRKLVGGNLHVAFSQDKDELVLEFHRENQRFFIKAQLGSQFSALLFPDQFERARRNSVDLWTDLYGFQVERVWVPANERVLVITLAGDFHLVGKFHGNRPNWLVFEGEKIKYVFNSHLKTDFDWTLSQLSRPIDQSFAAFIESDGNIQALYPTLGKWVVTYFTLRREVLSSMDLSERWTGWQEIIQQLETPNGFYLGVDDQQIPFLSLFPPDDPQFIFFDDPLEAGNAFVSRFQQVYTLAKEKSTWIRKVEKEIKLTEAYLQQQYARLSQRESGLSLEQIGHILMSFLHEIGPDCSEVELPNLYEEGKTVKIKLKADVSPQKNAEWYYRKAKNEKIEQDKLEENILAREEALVRLQEQLSQIRDQTTLKSLRTLVKREWRNAEPNQVGDSPLFKRFECLGFEILVGRNAKNNDLLTQRFSFKEDLWLHARDVQGSHVLIKHQAGKAFPTPVIEAAAGLAAYYSKARNESLAAVIVTPKKYVRKAKGLADGAVIIDKEKVVMVPPRANV